MDYRKDYRNSNTYYSSDDYHRRDGVRGGNKGPSGLWVILFALVVSILLSIPLVLLITGDSKLFNFFSRYAKEAKERVKETVKIEYSSKKVGLQSEDENLPTLGKLIEKFDESWLIDRKKRKLVESVIVDEDLAVLGKIITAGYSVDKKNDDGETLLFLAVKANKKKSVDFLIAMGSDVKTENNISESLLHLAAGNGNVDMAKMLIENGVYVSLKTKRNEATPLDYAARANQRDMSLFLVSCGAEVTYRCARETSDSQLKEFFNSGKAYWTYFDPTKELTTEEKLKYENKKKWKELSHHIKNGELIKLYNAVQNGADIVGMASDTTPALCLAAEYGQVEIATYLLHEFDLKDQVEEKKQMTSLHLAIKHNQLEMVDLLLANGFDPNAKDFFNNTPLHYAVAFCPLPQATIKLLEAGADLKSVNLKGQTPLHIAVYKNNVLGVKHLLDKGAKINVQDFNGNTMLHYLSMRGCFKDMLDLFYAREDELDFNIKNRKGETPRQLGSYDIFNFYEKHYKK